MVTTRSGLVTTRVDNKKRKNAVFSGRRRLSTKPYRSPNSGVPLTSNGNRLSQSSNGNRLPTRPYQRGQNSHVPQTSIGKRLPTRPYQPQGPS
jgi:hypothetical protein